MKIGVAAGLIGLIILSAWAGRLGVLGLSLVISGTGAFELYGSLRTPGSAFRGLVCSVYVLLGIATLCFAIVLPPPAIGLIYLMVAAFDLSQRFLPAYRVVLGFVAAVALAVLARPLVGWSARDAIEVALWAAAAATGAKLTACWLKRKAGIDRFGGWLPQGGILDRFDGLLFAAPVALVILGH